MTQSSNLSTSSKAAHRVPVAASSPLKLLGNWQLDQLVGQGTYSLVFDARPLGCPPSRPADYVVKVARPEYAQDPATRQTLQREAEVGRHSSHPNLVPILESHVEVDPPHVVMPKLSGATLADVLAGVGPLLVPQALWFARQIAQALHHLHQQGWVHGDVKPANIIVSRQGHATLIDLAFAMRANESLFSTQRPWAATLAYVAPEMLRSATQTQPAADVYSLGATLFEMLSGRRPFLQEDPSRLVEAHCQQTPPDLNELGCDVPEPVTQLVKRMLSKSPMRRPHLGEELIDVLVELEIEMIENRIPSQGIA